MWRHYNLKGRGYNVSAEVTIFYAATSQISTKFILSGIWQTALPYNEVKYKLHSSINTDTHDGGLDSDEPTTKPERRETEDKTEEESVVATVGHTSGSTLLVLLQVNCRSICNKILEFWNLIDTYNPDVVIGTESWLSEEINNAELFRD